MSRQPKRRRVRVNSFILPIDVEKGSAGLFYCTCPIMGGLLTSGATEKEAVDKVRQAVRDLAAAAILQGALS